MTTIAQTHDYPGLGLSLRHLDQDDNDYQLGAHGSCYGSHSDLIFVRELAMMDIMDKLTDKPDWHKKVFDEEIVAKWRKEALAIPDEELYKIATNGKRQYWERDGRVQMRDIEPCEPPKGIMSDVAFDCCIQELRSKAKYYEQTGIIPTLDACASAAKSDNLVTEELRTALRAAFNKLKIDQRTSPDWHPNTNDMVQDLVHPSMYPFVYARTRAFKEECVSVLDAIEKWAGKGTVVPKDEWRPDAQRDEFRYGVGGGEVPPQYWSNTYQWLPANLAFQDDGSVKFTSCINNLHPNKYSDIYRTIEKLVHTSLPMWDQCLRTVEYGAGRTESRMGKPEDPDDENVKNWIPDSHEACADVEVDEDDLEEEGYDPEYCEDINEYKWKVLRKPKLPEPSFEDVDYVPKEGKRLIDRFRDTGLQVIVKMASIELTPEKPEFPAGGWHIEGQMNEHICATALYYLDSDNITSSNLSFRMQTSAYINDGEGYDVGQDAYHWMEAVFGTNLGGGNSPCLQNYGTIETRQGRLLAFPNILTSADYNVSQHRVSPFKLIDPTKPGHRRFIALWLVDPAKRIISTANVPPQQMTWYAESLLGSAPDTRKEALAKLPAELITLLQENGLQSSLPDQDVAMSDNPRLPEELMDMVREYFEKNGQDMPMSVEEARQHRAKLMEERGAFVKTAEKGWQRHSYSFCEH
ncbi:hypothetical protein EK21DRAFT_74167 [Setomelanomma holmii]|uniref:Uncharacterized protein n=1 Tax=Setomelanomma holmii TaxID=210430 RepID=A0A9P4LJD4_9PLEO|nr:hypothetical protein EK21DRAFT_74167 [Setomelanomma holmii]